MNSYRVPHATRRVRHSGENLFEGPCERVNEWTLGACTLIETGVRAVVPERFAPGGFSRGCVIRGMEGKFASEGNMGNAERRLIHR